MCGNVFRLQSHEDNHTKAIALLRTVFFFVSRQIFAVRKSHMEMFFNLKSVFYVCASSPYDEPFVRK
jgi:hypothetical protein